MQVLIDAEISLVQIPCGTFLMGSPENEPERYDDESPQHPVTIKPFQMGKYPVTQAEWRAVAGLPTVDLDLDSDPSYFKGDNRPVELVSWEEGIEFCARLSQATGKRYRLPSEAEWEYACRAGTTTRFNFGETITTDLANYDGNYDNGSHKYRGETTDVGSFPLNAFGLYDMHGNVFEWCQDVWHDSYQGAPTDGSVWVTDGDDRYRIVRGGSWSVTLRNCHSGFRNAVAYYDRDFTIGFRVVCG